MAKYLSNRQKNLKVGISSYTENQTVLKVVGNADFSGVITATTFSGTSNYATTAGIATNLKDGLVGNIPYQSAPDTTAFLANGIVGYVLQSNGIGNLPTWVPAAPLGAVTGLVIRDSDNNIVGTAGSVSQLTIGTGLSVTATTGPAGIATITLDSNIVGTALSISGSSTLGTVKISSGIVTATTFSGNLAGTATTATNLADAANITTGTINKDRISTTNALTVLGDLYVSNNISFGGTTTQLNLQQLQIVDADIVLGIGTSFSPTDNTANHGGIAIASTEGTPLVNLNIVPGEINPTTYKKIMWFKGDTIGAGLTDAWLFNYAVGIGSTQVPNGVRLAAGGMQVTDSTITTPNLNITDNLGIGTTNPTSKLHVVGDAYVSGILTVTDINSTSDIRYKENIQTIPDAVEKVLQLNGVTFDWKTTKTSSAGVIAQEVEKILPSLISGDDPKTVNYNGIIGLLVEAVKELSYEIEMLKQKD